MAAKCDEELRLSGCLIVFGRTSQAFEKDSGRRLSKVLRNVGCGGFCSVDKCCVDVVGSCGNVLPGFAEKSPIDVFGVSEDVNVRMPLVLLGVVGNFENRESPVHGSSPQLLLA